jgi:hypothetical protein
MHAKVLIPKGRAMVKFRAEDSGKRLYGEVHGTGLPGMQPLCGEEPMSLQIFRPTILVFAVQQRQSILLIKKLYKINKVTT